MTLDRKALERLYQWKFRRSDFVPLMGIGEYGQRTGYYDGEGNGDFLGQHTPPKVHNRVIFLAAYNGFVAAVAIGALIVISTGLEKVINN